MRTLHIIVSLACVMLVASGCASHRAAVRCNGRLEPINTPAPRIKAARDPMPAPMTRASPAAKPTP